MASPTTIADWKDVEDGYVVDVTIRQTEADKYPSGWNYGLHLGEVGGDTILRYDNARDERPRETHARWRRSHPVSGDVSAVRPLQTRG